MVPSNRGDDGHGAPRVLQLLHRDPSGPGGVERHTRAMLPHLGAHVQVVLGWPTSRCLILQDVSLGQPHALPWLATLERTLAMAVRVSGVDVVHVQHALGYPGSLLDAVAALRGPKKIYSFRDYWRLCPNLNLQREDQAFCGVPADLSVCKRCLRATRGAAAPDLLGWRQETQRALNQFDLVLWPDSSVAELVSRGLDTTAWNSRVLPHGTATAPLPPLPASYFDGPLRVAFVGDTQRIKGYDTFVAVAERSRVGARFVHFGVPSTADISERVTALGPYEASELPRALRAHGVQVVCLPARSPETYSHVLSEVWSAGIPVMASSLGAIGARVRASGAGWCLPCDDVAAWRRQLELLVADRTQLAVAAAHVPRERSCDEVALELSEIYDYSAPTMPPVPLETERDAVAALTAHLGELELALQRTERELELARRALGEAPRVQLDPHDVQTSAAYRFALRARKVWLRVPAPLRRALGRGGHP